jgi:hypothetical protein
MDDNSTPAGFLVLQKLGRMCCLPLIAETIRGILEISDDKHAVQAYNRWHWWTSASNDNFVPARRIPEKRRILVHV